MFGLSDFAGLRSCVGSRSRCNRVILAKADHLVRELGRTVPSLELPLKFVREGVFQLLFVVVARAGLFVRGSAVNHIRTFKRFEGG